MGVNIRCLKFRPTVSILLTIGSYCLFIRNPSTDKVFINVGNYQHVGIRVLNLSGKIMFESAKIKQAIYNLDIQHYPPAVYIVEVQTDNQKQLFKLLKQ